MSFEIGKKSFKTLLEAIRYSKQDSREDKAIKLPSSTIEYDCDLLFSSDISGQEDSELVFVKKVKAPIVVYSCNITITNLKFLLSGSSLVLWSGSVVQFKDCVFERDDGENKFFLEGVAFFDGCKFDKVYLDISNKSKVTFTDCDFIENDFVEDQKIPGIYTESLDQTIKKCNFSGFNKAILAVASGVPIELKLEDCIFKAPDGAEAQITLCNKNPESIKIVQGVPFGKVLKLNYTSCSFLSIRKTQILGGKGGLDIYGAMASVDSLKIQVTEIGARFRKSFLNLNGLKIQGKLRPLSVGVLLDGPCTSKITNGLCMAMTQGISIMSERDSRSKHTLHNVAFVSNRVGLNIKNGQTEVGGCLFANNREYSMTVDVDKKEISSLGVNRDLLLSFWYNSYCEPRSGVEECDNRFVWNKVHDPHPFISKTAGDHLFYIEHLFDRLVRGYMDFQATPHSFQGTRGDVGVRSVKMLLKLMKQLKQPIIEKLKKKACVGGFLSRKKFDKETLFTPTEIFNSWYTIKNMNFVLGVFDSLEEMKNSKDMTLKIYTREWNKMRKIFLNMLIKYTRSRKLEFLISLAETKPFVVLDQLEELSDKQIYNDLENAKKFYDENMVVKYKVLLHILSTQLTSTSIKYSEKYKNKIELRSIRMLMSLSKHLQQMILYEIIENPRLGTFFAIRKVDEITLFKPSEVCESWLSLKDLKSFLNVFNYLKVLKDANAITPDEYTEQLKLIRSIFLRVMIKSNSETKLKFLTTWTRTKPLYVLWYLEQFGRKGNYAEIEDIDKLYDDNIKTKYKILIHILSLRQNDLINRRISVTWLQDFALQQLIDDVAVHKSAERKVPSSVSCYWNAPNDILMAYNLTLSDKATLDNPQVQGLIKRMSHCSDPTAKIPIFLRKLIKRGSLTTALKFCSQVQVSFFIREEFESKFLWQFLVDKKGYETSGKFKVFDDDYCRNCKKFTLGPELIQARHCDEPKYVYCRRCFKKLAERKTGNQYGTCPGSGVFLDSEDLALADIGMTYRNAAVNFHLKKYKKTLKVWYRCVIENCRGGSDKVENKMFTCELCGMFAQLDKKDNVDVILSLPNDVKSAWLICFLFKKAVEESRHLEHYFPFGYASQYLCPRKTPDVELLKRVCEPIPDDPSKLGKIRNSTTVDLMKFIMTSSPTHVRVLAEAPKIVAKMKLKEDDFRRHHYKRNDTDPNVERTEYWLQIQCHQEREINFQECKSKHGSYYAWHGSSIFNWHSIIRTGLKNMSDTKYKSTGAAHGAGIYHTPRFPKAADYSLKRHGVYGKDHDKPEIEMFAIGLIECIDDKVIKVGTTYVAQEEKHVELRFVMVVTFTPK